ncbi:unnamed protein product [Zymoseptoria tritici ST99CH_3D7]|uniref:Uncharacterized protein n=1 Tax=Zymoseptoria tritici (strain ST99CH_3D7) TaxID=1276538 RepID=A0A1X7RHL7_ZYMT9|nr:unnamed protein product [Zymoseptoria tritici ST99CH_3D7]
MKRRGDITHNNQQRRRPGSFTTTRHLVKPQSPRATHGIVLPKTLPATISTSPNLNAVQRSPTSLNDLEAHNRAIGRPHFRHFNQSLGFGYWLAIASTVVSDATCCCSIKRAPQPPAIDTPHVRLLIEVGIDSNL